VEESIYWPRAAGRGAASIRRRKWEKGKQCGKGGPLFEEQYSGCHTVDSNETKVGPPLKGLFRKSTLRDGKPVSDKSVRARIERGAGVMPSFANLLSDEEIDHVIACLKTL
jgi:cytochrome c2